MTSSKYLFITTVYIPHNHLDSRWRVGIKCCPGDSDRLIAPVNVANDEIDDKIGGNHLSLAKHSTCWGPRAEK